MVASSATAIRTHDTKKAVKSIESFCTWLVHAVATIAKGPNCSQYLRGFALQRLPALDVLVRNQICQAVFMKRAMLLATTCQAVSTWRRPTIGFQYVASTNCNVRQACRRICARLSVGAAGDAESVKIDARDELSLIEEQLFEYEDNYYNIGSDVVESQATDAEYDALKARSEALRLRLGEGQLGESRREVGAKRNGAFPVRALY